MINKENRCGNTDFAVNGFSLYHIFSIGYDSLRQKQFLPPHFSSSPYSFRRRMRDFFRLSVMAWRLVPSIRAASS